MKVEAVERHQKAQSSFSCRLHNVPLCCCHSKCSTSKVTSPSDGTFSWPPLHGRTLNEKNCNSFGQLVKLSILYFPSILLSSERKKIKQSYIFEWNRVISIELCHGYSSPSQIVGRPSPMGRACDPWRSAFFPENKMKFHIHYSRWQ